jgi:uncharacterized Zn finger protein
MVLIENILYCNCKYCTGLHKSIADLEVTYNGVGSLKIYCKDCGKLIEEIYTTVKEETLL